MEQIHLSRQNVAELEGMGSPLGVLTPDYVGQIYRNLELNPNGIWMSTGLTNTQWQNLLGLPDSLIHYSEIEDNPDKWTNYKVKRTVVTGLRASFEIEVYTDGQTTLNINDVIPQNFLGKSFFKLNRLTYLIREAYRWDGLGDGRVLRDGTISTTAGSPIVIGVDTDFVNDFHVNDKIFDNIGTLLGTVLTIDSSTQITLDTNALAVATNSPVRAFRQGLSFSVNGGFGEATFNDIINSSSSDPNGITSIILEGYSRGHMQQFEGTMGISYNLPTNDTDPLVPAGYTSSYLPKDLTVAALNVVYDPTLGGAYSQGSTEGRFVIVIDGYLL